MKASFSQTVPHSLGAGSVVSGLSKLILDHSCTLVWVSPNQKCLQHFWPLVDQNHVVCDSSGSPVLSPNVPTAALTDSQLYGHITLSSATLDHLTPGTAREHVNSDCRHTLDSVEQKSIKRTCQTKHTQ